MVAIASAIGCVVRLRSGGPQMTISSLLSPDGFFACAWVDDRALVYEAQFHALALDESRAAQSNNSSLPAPQDVPHPSQCQSAEIGCVSSSAGSPDDVDWPFSACMPEDGPLHMPTRATFVPGAQVRLRSGGPTMTVNESTEDDDACCMWFAGSMLRAAWIPAILLQDVSKPASGNTALGYTMTDPEADGDDQVSPTGV